MEQRLVYFLLLFFSFSGFFMSGGVAQSADGVYQMKRIVLDPGHGGPLPGCTYGQYQEKDIVLAIALRVGRLINENLPDVEVIYTRKTDVNVELMERSNIANRAKADLFLSIHVDSFSKSTSNGSSTWVMGSSKEATNLRVAMRENSVITYEEDYQTKYEGFDPNDPASYIMFSLMQSAYFDQSIKLGTLIQKYYKQNTSITTTRAVKQAGILVLHHTAMPSVLTEIGFLSNASDRAFLTSNAGKEKIARSIFNAISEYKSLVEGNGHIIALDNAEENRSNHTASETAAAASSSPGGSGVVESGTIFRVQVSASKTVVNRNRFGEYSVGIVEKRIGNYYKYFVGETKSYSEALSLQRQIRNKFKDAFIVAFENDQPVAITDEMKRN